MKAQVYKEDQGYLIVFPNPSSRTGNFDCYSTIEGHTVAHKDYVCSLSLVTGKQAKKILDKYFK